VAVVLSAQTTDKAVNQAPSSSLPWPTPREDGGARRGEAHGVHQAARLLPAKARNVIALSQALIERHGGEVPRSREALEALPGVGRKSANVILNTAFGEPVIAVDTHVFRVSNRTGLAPGTTPVEVEKPSTGWFRNPTEERPPLADPARALCLQGPRAGMPPLPHQRHLPLSRQGRLAGRRVTLR
jgi:endonuclease III